MWYRALSKNTGTMRRRCVADLLCAAIALGAAGWLGSGVVVVVADELSFNFDAEYGSQCLYVFDNADCAGPPLTSGCTDLLQAESCFSLKPLDTCVLLDVESGIYQYQTCVRWDDIETTGDATTTITVTTTATTTEPPECEDTTWEEHLGYLLWVDPWNFTCAEYDANNWCSELVNYSYSPNERGATAAHSCCACGGGTTGGNPFVHPDTITQLPSYLEDCSDFEFGLWQPCPFLSLDAADRACFFTCRNIEQRWCGEPEANTSGILEGNLSARQACCMCGGGDKPPAPYLVYDTTTCTFFSDNITVDGLSDVMYDENGLRYQFSYGRANPPACWTGLAFVLSAGVAAVAVVGFAIQRCADTKRSSKINVDNRNRLPRQSAMEISVIAQKRRVFEAEQKAEEDEEVERQRVLRNAEADAWIGRANADAAKSLQNKWQRDQDRRNQATRDAKVRSRGSWLMARRLFGALVVAGVAVVAGGMRLFSVLRLWLPLCLGRSTPRRLPVPSSGLLWVLLLLLSCTQLRQAQAARVAAFEAQHGADWEKKLLQLQSSEVAI